MSVLPVSNLLERRRRARRRGQRGGVAVEAVIVVVMMTGIVMGTWYTRLVFSGKLLTLTASRADAWRDALKGCDSTGSLGDVYKHLHEESKDTSQSVCQDPADCSNGNGNVDGLSNDGSTQPSWFPDTDGNSNTKSLSVAVDSLYATTLNTTTEFACNPKPHDELDLGGGMSDAINQILKIPDEEVQSSTVAKRCMQQYVLGQPWHEKSCDDFAFNGCQKAHVACPDPLHTWAQRWDIDLNKNLP